MNRMLLALFALAAIALPGIATHNLAMYPNASEFSATDESAVRANLRAFVNSWNQHDMKAMHEIDTEDVEWINVVGQDWLGKETVAKGHSAIHKGMSAKTTMSMESATVRSIAPNVAVAVAVLHVTASTDPRFAWTKATKTRASFTMVKRDGSWKIAHFQNTIMDPKAETEDVPSFAEVGFPPPDSK